MLTKKILQYTSRFIGQRISQFNSIVDMINDKKGILEVISKHNQLRLNPLNKFTNILNFSQALKNSHISDPIEFSVYSPITLKRFTVKYKLSENTASYDFLPDQLQSRYPTKLSQGHYSLKANIPLIGQIKPLPHTLYLFNLPDDISQNQIREQLTKRGYSIKNIEITYGLFNLPGYATVSLTQSEQGRPTLKDINLLGKKCFIKTDADTQRLKLDSRFLVIEGLQKKENPKQLVVQLAKYGKIMYIDIPSTGIKNLSMAKVKQIYKNSYSPVKINFHKINGEIESEYYPPYEEPVAELDQDTFESQYHVSIKKRKEMYDRRLRFCQNIDVYEKQQQKFRIQNKGFVLVAYSCSEQAQNCYFGIKQRYKVDLLKGRYEFQFDEEYKMQLLRFIDNQFLEQRVKNAPIQIDLNEEKYKLSMTLFQRLKYELMQNQIQSIQNSSKGINTNFALYKGYLQNLRQIKKSIGKNDGYGKSFDQLAEMELYGKMLPKLKANQKNFSLDDYDDLKGDHFQSFKNPSQKNIPNIQILQKKHLKDRRAKERTERRYLGKGKRGNQTVEMAPRQMRQSSLSQIQNLKINDLTGKAQFSTFSMKNFRKPTFSEKANRSLRYNQMVRTMINEYLGIFSSEKFQSNFSKKNAKLINPHNVKFSNGDQFLTQQQLQNILQFHRIQSQASLNLNTFITANEAFKSFGISVEEEIIGKMKQNYKNAIVRLTDFGVIQQIYQYKNQKNIDIDKFVDKLNAKEAQFGNMYDIVNKDNKDYIVKIRKLEHIAPLDRINNIQNFKKDCKKTFNNQQWQKKLQLIEKHLESMIQSGKIPQELKKAFNIQSDQFSFDNLLSTVGVQNNIWKKDLEMLNKLEQFSQDQIQADIAQQIEIQKTRVLQRNRKQSDYFKDPSKINVRDKDGKFKVSKFRQI